jgi:hypothetical protein
MGRQSNLSRKLGKTSAELVESDRNLRFFREINLKNPKLDEALKLLADTGRTLENDGLLPAAMHTLAILRHLSDEDCKKAVERFNQSSSQKFKLVPVCIIEDKVASFFRYTPFPNDLPKEMSTLLLEAATADWNSQYRMLLVMASVREAGEF